ncbi:MAG: hypothetical protein V8S24_14305 [Gordonibacter pamelaeae]
MVAPAGYGKTCAALQYARYLEGERPGSVAWLSVDAEDNDPLRFWMHVHAALGLPSSLRRARRSHGGLARTRS